MTTNKRRTSMVMWSAGAAAGLVVLAVMLFMIRARLSGRSQPPISPAREAEAPPPPPPGPFAGGAVPPGPMGPITGEVVPTTSLAPLGPITGEAGARRVYVNQFTESPGAEWSDALTGATPTGRRPFLGRFVEQPVSLNLTALPPHKRLRITFDLYLMGSWDGSSKRFGEKIWDLKLMDGRSLIHTTFGNCGFFTDNNEQSFPDSYPCRPHPAWTGSVEHGTLGTKQSWGGPNRTWDVSSVYHFALAFPHSDPDVTFEFKATMRGGKDKGYGLANMQVDTLAELVARTESELAALWKDLGDADAERAFKAQWDLIAGGDPAVDYIAKHLDENIDLPKAKLEELIKALASAESEEAKQAQAGLIGQGRVAQMAVANALDDNTIPAAAKPKLVSIQRTITTYPETATELRLHRARQLLLAIHSPAAEALAARIPPEHPEPDRAIADLVASGHAAGVLGDWKKAFACFRDAVAAGSAREGDWSCAAVTALAVGDTNASLKFCRGIMNRFAKQDDASAAERCAKNCLMLPGIPEDLLAKAVERAEFAVTAGPDSRWRQMARGMAEYRSGQWSNALEWLRQPELSSNLEVSAIAWPFGAMARHRSGDSASARQALEEANRRLKVIVESGELARSRYNTWDNYARAFAARAEAERLILGRASSPPVDPAAAAEGLRRWQPIFQLLQSGEKLAEQKQWGEASEAFAQALQQPGFAWDIFELRQSMPAPFLPVASLLASNETRHLELCRMLLERTNANLAPVVSQGYAGACLARMSHLPPEVKDRALAFARQVSQRPDAAGGPGTLLLRGMINYREGRWNEAFVALEGAEAIGEPVTQARALAFRGMAAGRLGRTDDARRALKDAEQALSNGPTGQTGWWGVGLCEVALNELRAVMAAHEEPKSARQ